MNTERMEEKNKGKTNFNTASLKFKNQYFCAQRGDNRVPAETGQGDAELLQGPEGSQDHREEQVSAPAEGPRLSTILGSHYVA
jgi:hypothetical protein